jgi:hypothetical protein
LGRTRSVDLTEYLTHAKAVGVSPDTDVSRDVGRVVAALMREDNLPGPADVSTLLPVPQPLLGLFPRPFPDVVFFYVRQTNAIVPTR